MNLLAQILFTNCPSPSLKGVKIPAGRTPKACTHILAQFKDQHFKEPETNEKTPGDDGEIDGEEAPVTSKSKTTGKRKAGEKAAPKRAKKVKTVEEPVDLDDNTEEDKAQVEEDGI